MNIIEITSLNHPGVEGHEAYAIVLMKLFEE